jgi:hypothetical protein
MEPMEQFVFQAVGTLHRLKMFSDTCADNNDDSCVAFGLLDSNACVKLPKVDLLCPKTCGICGKYSTNNLRTYLFILLNVREACETCTVL